VKRKDSWRLPRPELCCRAKGKKKLFIIHNMQSPFRRTLKQNKKQGNIRIYDLTAKLCKHSIQASATNGRVSVTYTDLAIKPSWKRKNLNTDRAALEAGTDKWDPSRITDDIRLHINCTEIFFG
jgi:hypothetical protein